MIAVAIPGIAPSVVVGPLPVERQLMGCGIYAESLHVVLSVAASGQEDERMSPVQERCSEVVLRRAVTVAVAPVAGIAAWQRVVHPELSVGAYGVWLARGPLEVEQILSSRVGIGTIGIVVSHGVACVYVHVADVGHSSVWVVNNHVVGPSHEHLGLAVGVPVVAHGIILLIGTGDHVGPQVDPPQPVAFQVVDLDVVVARVVADGIDPGGIVVGTVVALHDEFRDAVAREVGQCDVVDVAVSGHVAAVAGLDGLHGKLDVLL